MVGRPLGFSDYELTATKPPVSGKLSPLDQYTRGLEDMSNASLQRDRQGSREDADESASAVERCPDLSGTGHSRGHLLQLGEGLSVAGRVGAGIGEGS